MKKLAAIVIMLALPATVLAIPTEIYLESGGLESLSYEYGSAPTTMDMDITVDLGYNLIGQIDGALYMDSQDTAISITGITYASPFSTYAFASGAPVVSTIDQHKDFGRVYGGGGSEVRANSGADQLFATMTLSGIDTLPVGTYVISVGQATESAGWWDDHTGDYGNGPFWSADYSQGVPVENPGGPVPFDSNHAFTLTITPEPATMLLLVGALPFLRRRTA